jgi:hypothetical protein
MSIVEDHTQEFFQYGEHKVQDINFIEVNVEKERYEIHLLDGDIHYYRFTCVLTHMNRENEPIMTIS